jgi:hypothetical protein
MNLSKAALVLEKINMLFNNINLNSSSISTIERDLMLSYIRQLYEYCQEKEVNVKVTTNFSESSPKPETPIKEVKRDTYKPPRIIEISDNLREEITEPLIANPKIPRVEITEQAPLPNVPEPTSRPTPPKVEIELPVVKKEIEALFEFKQVKELSEKLSTIPIQDLTKAIALNDKLVFSNQLFGGALVAFNEVIRTLNNMRSFDEAKKYLIELAVQHNWAKENNEEVAKDFIKLVRRRFL